MDRTRRIEYLRETFATCFGAERPRIFAAPGRVNLIGEHTDYNGGFVLPLCIDRETLVAAAPNGTDLIRMRSMNDELTVDCPLADIRHTEINGWANYPLGVAYILQQHGAVLVGTDVLVSGDLPRGAGLASSASLEVAACLALTAVAGLELPAQEIPFICCEAENDFVGLPCGIMDQFVVTHGRRGHALLLDCREMRSEHLPLDDFEYVLVITNSGKKRRLTEAAYGERRRQCAEGVNYLQRYFGETRHLCDVTPGQFARYQDYLPDIVRKRCAHVISENDRVLQAAELLRCNQLRRVGELMAQSHYSLRDFYEVSCPELDTIVEAALTVPGVLGSRMTGAGFGGCAVTLVEESSVEELAETVTRAFHKQFSYLPEFYSCRAEQGAGEICDG